MGTNATLEMNSQAFRLPGELQSAVRTALQECKNQNVVSRVWGKDATLWTGKDEGKWLGWLDVVRQSREGIPQLEAIAADIKSAGMSQVLLLGMGGSSLCPEVVAKTFGQAAGYPRLLVLDSTDPAQIASFDRSVNPSKTAYIVSSKSGSTLEPNILQRYFFDRARSVLGAEDAAKRFIAITDPGSQLEQLARREGFRHILAGVPSIGGRFSALSNFGVAPAAIAGIDLRSFLGRTEEMVLACRNPSVEENPGLMLGVVLGTLGSKGHDKITMISSPGVSDLGAWLEQLIAESTGKLGKGLVPVDGEHCGPPDVYGRDRLFVYLRLESDASAEQDRALQALERAGHPVVTISIADRYNLGQEFFRWEFATAIAGSLMGINPFDQPDVEAAKVEARKLTSEYERTGSLAAERPMAQERGIQLFTDDANVAQLKKGDSSVRAMIKAHLDRIQPGDYFALLAYVEMNERHVEALQTIRHAVRDRRRVATCLGFGPRFLHSTGQLYKGGPNTGVFLQITCADATDLPVPDQKYTFSVVKAAQARGDFQVLLDRRRRAVRVHLTAGLDQGLAFLRELVEAGLTR
ncbi:MAG TPA: bifunctional transaldolase/phosoglucose isomerase [Phycisphaerae bacterium]|nr:bifunctional transaldolase/phosoglucose isomerase [Phycisphaerae bacterium]